MNMNAQAYNQYKKTTVETVAPEKLLLMLYEGVLKNIRSARKGIEDKDINRAHQEIVKAEEIILELMSTLNMDYEISNGLLALYRYMYDQLVQANIQKDTAILEEVEGYLSELGDTWAEAARILKTSGHMQGQTEVMRKTVEPTTESAKGIQATSVKRSGINIQG
ncbi:MAG: flagellar export chaperone FliS [Bacillota bacterium]|nr:flagellar export chaperone FliS [Bacillota bacterium]